MKQRRWPLSIREDAISASGRSTSVVVIQPAQSYMVIRCANRLGMVAEGTDAPSQAILIARYKRSLCLRVYTWGCSDVAELGIAPRGHVGGILNVNIAENSYAKVNRPCISTGVYFHTQRCAGVCELTMLHCCITVCLQHGDL